MAKKVLRKPKKAKTSSSKTTSDPRILTAEGWRRLMMKKYRK